MAIVMGTSGQLETESSTSSNNQRRRRIRKRTPSKSMVATTSLLLGPYYYCYISLPSTTMLCAAFAPPACRLFPRVVHLHGHQATRHAAAATHASSSSALFSTDASLSADPIASTSTPTTTTNHSGLWKKEFVAEVPEGLCVGLSMNDLSPDAKDRWVRKVLHPKEVEFALGLSSEKNRLSFFVGRLAMRYALLTASSCYPGGVSEMVSTKEICDVPQEESPLLLPCVSKEDPCILKDEHGRPMVPPGFLGSISHKDNIGVALVAEDGDDASLITKGIGIDIEKASTLKSRIERKILTPNERESLGNLEGISRDEEVLLRFSLKESVYKAMHPLINQYVGFQEAEITPKSDGTASVDLNLKSGQHAKLGTITANWRKILDDQYYLTSASVTLK